MEKTIEQLEKLNPNIVSAPPSMLKLLATELQKRRLKISPKLLYSYAEVLYPNVKKYLENNFKCEVHEVYQGSEGYYALTCSHGNLHINEDMVFFELLDDRGLPTKDGEPCNKLLVTDLHKKSQPIIRYELNDIITISKEKCSCGSNFKSIDDKGPFCSRASLTSGNILLIELDSPPCRRYAFSRYLLKYGQSSSA